MCGFVGLYKSEIDQNDQKVLSNMSTCIAHRGPDEASHNISDHLAVAFRRLSIIDLDHGKQPFSAFENRYVGVLNGEIYNYMEIREELLKKGYQFSTKSEIEVILTLYHDKGIHFWSELRGMFAILIYDTEKKQLIGGRDQFGIKPFYYSVLKDQFLFSSELKALLIAKKELINIDSTSLQHYLTFQYVPEPRTIVKKVSILTPGTYFIYQLDDIGNPLELHSYASTILQPSKTISYDQKLKTLRKTLESSVAYHMSSDVEVATLLSSGIDSAIITTIASRFTPGIKSFTIAFNEKEYSEMQPAAEIASHLNVDHIQLQFTVEDFMQAYPKAIYHLDGPMADPSTVAIYLLAKEVSKYVKVVLSGEGSDEIFGGYNTYKTAALMEKIENLPTFLKQFMSVLGRILPKEAKGKNILMKSILPIEKKYIGNTFLLDEDQKKNLLVPYNQDVHFSDVTKPTYDTMKKSSYLTKMQHCDIHHWLRGDILLKGDRLSMAHSLELRTPFMDKEVFEVAKTLCDSDKISHNTTKYILRDAFKDVLNPETFIRPKRGFPVPVRKWLKNELYDWAFDIIQRSQAEEYIIKKTALHLLEEHRIGKADHYRSLWLIIVFLSWYELYITNYEDTLQSILHENN